MATNITIKAESESGFIKVYVNDEDDDPKLVLGKPGTTTIPLEDNEVHNLTYFVQGKPGQKFVIKIVSPPKAAWTERDTVDGDKKVTGQHRIRL